MRNFLWCYNRLLITYIALENYSGTRFLSTEIKIIMDCVSEKCCWVFKDSGVILYKLLRLFTFCSYRFTFIRVTCYSVWVYPSSEQAIPIYLLVFLAKVNGQTKFFIMLCSDMIVLQLQHKIIFPVHLQVKELPTRPFSGKGCVRA